MRKLGVSAEYKTMRKSNKPEVTAADTATIFALADAPRLSNKNKHVKNWLEQRHQTNVESVRFLSHKTKHQQPSIRPKL
jgi:hypothetical protein